MIRKPQNWENVQAISDTAVLPVGGYIVKIFAAEVKSFTSKKDGRTYENLELSIDIVEGEYKDFYRNDYTNQKMEPKRWKGVKKFSIPTDDGSDSDKLSQRVLKGATEAIEDSNPGYHWDWDETKLKGKLVGCVFRLEEWYIEDENKKGWKTQPFKFVPISDIKSGKFKLPNFKPHKNFPNDTPDNYQNNVDTASDIKNRFEELDINEGDLPF